MQVAGLERLHLLIGDLDTTLVGVGVEGGRDGEPGRGGGRGDGLDDDLVGFEGTPAPVQGDRGEQPVLDPVPFRGSRRQVRDGDLQPGLGGELGELSLS